MRVTGLSLSLGVLLTLPLQPAHADIDPAEYELKSAVRSSKESQRLQAEFELDRQREAERQRLQEESAARQLAAQKAAFEALPEAERLTRARCKPCHAGGNYMSQRHNRLGWELVILRMQHLNGARLADGERSVIANHLAQTYLVTGGAALMEAVQQLVGALAPVWLWIAWKGGRSRFSHRAGPAADVNKGA